MQGPPEDASDVMALCVSCGDPRGPAAIGRVCAGCVEIVLDRRACQAAGPDGRSRQGRARKALLAELGMPLDAAWWSLRTVHHGGEWDGFAIEMFGMEPPKRVWPPPWPFVALRVEGSATVGILKQIWLRRVRCPDSSLIIEARWHPEREESIAIRGLEQVTRDAELRLALEGLRLIRTFNHRGRPPGRTTIGRNEFLQLYQQARQECLADGRTPTDDNLLIYLPFSKATLVRYRNKWLPKQ